MAIKGLVSHYNENRTRTYQATEEQCEKVILTAFDILEKIGMKVMDPDARALLEQAGCTCEDDLVKVPRESVIKAVELAPSHIDIYDRNGKKVMDVGGTNVYFGTGPTNPFVNDFETKERRQSKVSDVALSTKVSDALDNIEFIMNLADPADCEVDINDVYSMREMLKNTTKPIMCLAVSEESLSEQFEMACAVTGGEDKFREKPFVMSLCGDPITPLALPDAASKKLIFCARHGIPLTCPSGVQMGTTGPVSLPTAVALGLAENFLCLVLTEAAEAGAAYMGGIVVLEADMRTMASCYSLPTHCISEQMVADIYHYLDLPLLGTCSSDAKIVDSQLVMENCFNIYSAALDGGHLSHDIAFMDSALTTDLDALTVCDEIIRYARMAASGTTYEDEDFAFDVLEEVGPQGEFLTSEHTLDNLGKMSRIGLFEHRQFQVWQADGSKTFIDRAHEKTEKILKEHVPEALPDDVLKQIDAILNKSVKRVS